MQYITLRAKVNNPKADRRRKFDWRSEAAFRRGMAFTINEKAKIVHPSGDRKSAIPIDDVRAKLIIAQGQPATPKPEHLMIAHDLSTGQMLTKLLKKGAVTVESMQEVLK